MTYHYAKKWDNARDFVLGTSEFYAIFGTPNANSSAYFLMDHLDQVDKTIDTITATASKGLDIKFKGI